MAEVPDVLMVTNAVRPQFASILDSNVSHDWTHSQTNYRVIIGFGPWGLSPKSDLCHCKHVCSFLPFAVWDTARHPQRLGDNQHLCLRTALLDNLLHLSFSCIPNQPGLITHLFIATFSLTLFSSLVWTSLLPLGNLGFLRDPSRHAAF